MKMRNLSLATWNKISFCIFYFILFLVVFLFILFYLITIILALQGSLISLESIFYCRTFSNYEPQTSENIKIPYTDIFSDAVCQGHRGHGKTKTDSHTKLIMDNRIFRIWCTI